MFYVLTASLKDGHVEQFHSWAAQAEKRFATASPKGWRFKGIFLTTFGLGSGEAEIHWEVDSYAAFDNAVEAHDAKGEYAKVVGEYFSHIAAGTQRGRVLRSVTDTKLQIVRADSVALAL
jgi:hypothetical protein